MSISASSVSMIGSVGVGSKRSFSDTVKVATREQMDILLGLAKLELGGDKTTWTMEAIMTCGLMELVPVELVGGKVFLVPKRAPADGKYSVEFMATVAWTLLVIEQDLTASGHGVILKVAGATDQTPGVFPEEGGLVIKDPVEWFAVAKGTRSGVPSSLEAIIREAVLGHAAASRGVMASAAIPGAQGGSECVKKATLSSVLDINGEVRVVYNKEGGNARIRMYAALLREWAPDRLRVFLGADFDSSMERIRDGMMSESEREMLPGEAMLSLSRMDTIVRLEAWQDPEAFKHFLLLDLPMSDWQFSLKHFRSPETSMWTKNYDRQGSDNLLAATMNWFNFQRVTKDERFHRCGDPIRELFEDQGRFIYRYYNDFLQFQLERMIRGYAQELTQTQGKVARLAGGLALGGQGESVALLQWFVREFVGLARGGTWERAPHDQHYGSEQYRRIANKPGAGDAKGKGGASSLPSGGRVGGSPGGGGVRVPPYHDKGLCLWYLAGKLGLTNQKGEVFVCRTPDGEHPVTHAALSTVKLSTVKRLMKDAKFTAVCGSETLKTSILTEAIAKANKFKAE